MRSLMAFAAVACLMLAGCSDNSKAADCPDAYGEDYESQYHDYVETQKDAGNDVVDTDGDCVPDDFENVYQTDPQNATDYPDQVPVLNATLNNTQPPLILYGPFDGTVQSAAGPLSVGGTTSDFKVDEGATLVFAELKWDSPVIDLNVALRSPAAGQTGTANNFDHTGSGGNPGMPNSPETLTISGADVLAGDWQGTAFANGAAAEQDYQLAVTVFYGATEVPAGYTAFV